MKKNYTALITLFLCLCNFTAITSQEPPCSGDKQKTDDETPTSATISPKITPTISPTISPIINIVIRSHLKIKNKSENN